MERKPDQQIISEIAYALYLTRNTGYESADEASQDWQAAEDYYRHANLKDQHFVQLKNNAISFYE